MLTSNFNAEYGNFSGGQVQVITKSGTNELHGSAFEFLRDTRLDARNFFAAERAKYDRNQFGGGLGGPIRKNQVFFFADYQGSRMTQGIETGLISVPSLQNRDGDFSDVAGSLTGTVNGQYWADLLSQKLGHTVTPGEPYYMPGCTRRGVRPAECAHSPACLVRAREDDAAVHSRAESGRPHLLDLGRQRDLRDDKGALRIDANSAGARSRRTTSPTITGWIIRIPRARAAPMCRDSMRSRWDGRSSPASA